MKKAFFVSGLILFALSSTTVFGQLNESFEGDFPPPGWTVQGGNLQSGESWSKGISTTYFQCHHTGEAAAVSESYIYPDEVSPNNWLITPELNIENHDSIVFFVKPSSVQYPTEHFELWLSETGTDISDFTEKLHEITFTATDANQWTRVAISLSNWNGESVYLAFVHNNCSGQNMLLLDDISTVSGDATTQIPTELTYNLNCYYKNGYLVFENTDIKINNLQIFSTNGTKHLNVPCFQTGQRLYLFGLKQGIYIVSFMHNNQRYSQKICIN